MRRPLREVRDGQALAVLSAGLAIVRRRKHEPIDFEAAGKKGALRRLTGKLYGSKFSAEWTLDRYVKWITEQVSALGWSLQTGPIHHDVVEAQIMGYCQGQPVHTIRIVSDGRHLHAYPIEDTYV